MFHAGFLRAVAADAALHTQLAEHATGQLPLYLMGHSLGGSLALTLWGAALLPAAHTGRVTVVALGAPAVHHGAASAAQLSAAQRAARLIVVVNGAARPLPLPAAPCPPPARRPPLPRTIAQLASYQLHSHRPGRPGVWVCTCAHVHMHVRVHACACARAHVHVHTGADVVPRLLGSPLGATKAVLGRFVRLGEGAGSRRALLESLEQYCRAAPVPKSPLGGATARRPLCSLGHPGRTRRLLGCSSEASEQRTYSRGAPSLALVGTRVSRWETHP